MAIATGSMVPYFNAGDVVILQKIKPEDVKLYDVVEYKTTTKNIVHRVVEIDKKQDGLYFITKGDHNPSNDLNPVFQDKIVAKVIFVVPIIGYPAVWLNFSK